MPSRRFHSKSRHGCSTCKQSKVRCDLERPICKRCFRLERPCSFATDDTSIVAISGGRPNSHRAMTAKEATLSQPAIKDLELMHHYSTSTCFTMTDIAENFPLWQYDVPRLAFKHEFLLHGLLALSALHMSQTQESSPSSSFGDLARNHQSVALSSYIPLLRDINRNNSNALFAFSAVLGATSFAFLQQPEEQPSSHDFVKGVADIFELLVGSTVIAVEGRTWLKSGNMSSLLTPHPFLSKELSHCSFDAKESLDAIINRARPRGSPADTPTAEETWSTYASSAEQLGSLFPARADRTIAMGKVVGWPALAGSPLIYKLKHLDPVALIILAHYGAALHLNEHIWYLRGLGNRLVRAIADIVDEEWQPYLRWPLDRTSI